MDSRASTRSGEEASTTTRLSRSCVNGYQKFRTFIDPMVRIQQRNGRHFMDEEGRVFWINGPERFCYLSEQRQWRSGLTFLEILEWKQCAPSGLVSQRFGSIKAACEAFEHNTVQWSFDRYLRRMGDQMALNRAVSDYKPTAIKLAEASGGGSRSAPWAGCLQESLCVALGPSSSCIPVSAAAHSRSQFTEFQPALFAFLKLLKQRREIMTEMGEVALA